MAADEFEQYNTAVSLAIEYLDEHGREELEYCTFDDLVEMFFSYVLANEGCL